MKDKENYLYKSLLQDQIDNLRGAVPVYDGEGDLSAPGPVPGHRHQRVLTRT